MKVAIVLSGLAALCAAQELAAPGNVIVGLGSSYAAGENVTKPIQQVVSDALNNRANHVTTYGGYTGAVSGSLLSDVPGQAANLQYINTSAVFMLSGGNDMNYVGCLNNPDGASCTAGSYKTDITEFKQLYKAALSSIRSNAASYNPNVLIYPVTYPQAISSDTNCDPTNAYCKFTPTQKSKITQLFAVLSAYTVQAIKEYRDENPSHKVIPIWMHNTTTGNLIDSTDPYVNGAYVKGTNGGTAWHPTSKGDLVIGSKIFIDIVGNNRLPL